MTRVVELYGRLKDAGSGEKLELELSDGVTAGQVLAMLRSKLGASIDGAALASEDAVLSSNDLIPKSGRLAALPPVCGG